MTVTLSRRALFALAAALPAPALAQSGYPTRPVRLVVPFPAGGGTDIVARIYAQKMTELLGQPIKVTVLHCGYIASEMNEKVQQQVKFMVSTEDGVRSMVDAIEKEKAHAYVPALPWTALAPLMKHAPLPMLKRLL